MTLPSNNPLATNQYHPPTPQPGVASADAAAIVAAARAAAREAAASRLASDPHAVDMFAVARIAQDVSAVPSHASGAVKLVAPAKVNLYLEIGEKRPDGYHEALSIMHALMLHDVLRMKLVPVDPFAPAPLVSADSSPKPQQNLRIELTCRMCEGLKPLDVDAENNIVSKAIRLFAYEIGRDCPETLRVSLEKHIPAEAGLGGGSADAAAALIGAAKLWNIPSDDARIEKVARSLGADVAFFIRGGCACLTGVGDVFAHELEPMKSFVVLVKPDGGVSTAAAYSAFDAEPACVSASDRAAAQAARCAQDVPLRNNLVQASEQLLPELAEVLTWANEHSDVDASLMSGSGSAVFACCRTFEAAARVVTSAQAHGWWARSTMFGAARAALVPSS